MPPTTGSPSAPGPGDIVVTADIPLADRSLKAGAAVIGNTGVPFTTASIGMAMASRELMSNLRAMGEITGGPKPMTPRDRSRFLSALDETIQKLRRQRSLTHPFRTERVVAAYHAPRARTVRRT